MGKESVLGSVVPGKTAVDIFPLHPGQRCTPRSIAGHAMYERSDPYFEHVAGGCVNMSNTDYEQLPDGRTCRADGALWQKDQAIRVKIEGAGVVGPRRLSLIGLTDPYSIAHVDQMMAWARQKLVDRFGDALMAKYEIHYHLFGSGQAVSIPASVAAAATDAPKELGIAVEVVCRGSTEDAKVLDELATLAARNLFYARLPRAKGTAGAAALMSDDVLVSTPACEWTLSHLMEVDTTHALHRRTLETVGGGARSGVATYDDPEAPAQRPTPTPPPPPPLPPATP